MTLSYTGTHTDTDIRSHPEAPEIERWTPPARRPTIRVNVSVDNNHCHRYAVCQQEAPQVFQLTPDGRLVYNPSPDPLHLEAVRQAARVCPMQAIEIEERSP